MSSAFGLFENKMWIFECENRGKINWLKLTDNCKYFLIFIFDMDVDDNKMQNDSVLS